MSYHVLFMELGPKSHLVHTIYGGTGFPCYIRVLDGGPEGARTHDLHTASFYTPLRKSVVE